MDSWEWGAGVSVWGGRGGVEGGTGRAACFLPYGCYAQEVLASVVLRAASRPQTHAGLSAPWALSTPCPPPPPQAYSNNLVDYHMILDLLPTLAASYFRGKLPATLSYAQVCVGKRWGEEEDRKG